VVDCPPEPLLARVVRAGYDFLHAFFAPHRVPPMTPPMHHDDYVSTHFNDHHTEEAAPAHHLPFDRTTPADPTQDTTEQDNEPESQHESHHESHHDSHQHDAFAADSDEESNDAIDAIDGVSDETWTAGTTEHVHAEHRGVHRDAPETDEDTDEGSESARAAAEPDATGAVDSHEAVGSDAHQPVAVASAHAPVQSHATPAGDSVSSAADARGLLEGIALNLRALAGREGADGAPVAIFPRGVDLLEVRMHISRDRDIDLNFRVAGPTPPSPRV